MWAKNLLFVTLCLVGAGSLIAGLWREERIQDPAGFNPQRRQDPEFAAVVAAVDGEFRLAWQQAGLEPTGQADDLTLARRLSLGLMGTVPSLEEIRALQAQPPAARPEWWLSRLLADRRYADYVAERLARAYVGTENGPFIVYRRRRFVTWISDRLAENRPYDALVRELIGDSGLWTDTPAVNFVTVTADPNQNNQPDEKRLAGRVTRAFLGLRIDCLQCHDDHLGTMNLGTAATPRGGTQRDFHQLAAFFGSTENSLFGIKDGKGTYRFSFPAGSGEEEVRPQVPFGREFLPTEGTRRHQLAAWVTHPENRPFARTTVNRVWALLFGRPLVEPIDDIPLYGEYPPGLETLSRDLVAHGYDLQRLIRVIAATEAFQRDSRADFDMGPEHERLWATFPITRLRPEQVAGSIIQACSLTTIDANAHILSQLIRFFQQNDFVLRYGDMGQDEFTDRGGTVTQRLLMMNGQLVKERTSENPLVNAATAIAQLSPDDATATEVAYLAALTRDATPREQQYFERELHGLVGAARNQYLEDLFWVLLNSSEFSWNH